MPAPESPPQVTTQDLAPPIEQQEPLEEAPQDTVLTEAQSASNGVVANDDAAMYVDVLGDIGMDAVGELEPMESAIPDELLLHPWNNGTDDTALPLFYEDAPTGSPLKKGKKRGGAGWISLMARICLNSTTTLKLVSPSRKGN